MPQEIDPVEIRRIFEEQASPNPLPPPPPRSPFGYGLRTTSASKYLEGLTFEDNPEFVKAKNQGFLDTMGNSAAQAAVGIGAEIGEGVGYLGVGNIIDTIRGHDEEWGNSMSSKIAEWNEQFKEQGMPVYTTPDDEGFQPLNYKWWGKNMPSIASAVSLLIPAWGAVKGIGFLGKIAGGARLAKMLGISAQALEGAGAMGMSLASRRMEGMMESAGMFQQLKQEALAAGKSEKEAIDIASKGARDVYAQNWALLGTDLLQFGLAFKTFKGISRLKNASEAVKRTRGQMFTQFGVQAGLEAGEEITQYQIGEEAKVRRFKEAGIIEEDYKTYPDRLLEYASDPDMWTSGFFGAIGGALFEGVGGALKRRDERKQKIKDQTYKSELEKALAVYKDNPLQFAKSNDVDMITVMTSAIENRRAKDVEDMLINFRDKPIEGEENVGEAKAKAEEWIGQLHYLEKLYNNIFTDPTKKDDPEMARFELINRANVLSNQSLSKEAKRRETVELEKIASERGLDSAETLLLRNELELSLLNNEFKKSKVADDDIKQTRAKELETIIAQQRDSIKTNKSIDDAALNERLNIDKSMLGDPVAAGLALHLSTLQGNREFDMVQTTDGRKEIKEDLKNFREEKAKKDFEALVGAINKDSSPMEVKQLQDVAKKMGKEKEFLGAYNGKITELRSKAAKFDPRAVSVSLTGRFGSSKLLREHETAQIHTLALQNGGIPEDIEALTPPVIEYLAKRTPEFLKALVNYYDKATPVASPNKTFDASKTEAGKADKKKNKKSKQPVEGFPENDDADSTTEVKESRAQKDAETNPTKKPWNVAGVQFKTFREVFNSIVNDKDRDDTAKFRALVPLLKRYDREITKAAYNEKSNRIDIEKYGKKYSLLIGDIASLDTVAKIIGASKTKQTAFDVATKATSDIAVRTDWDFLNGGHLKPGEKLHIEHQFDDTFNKSLVNVTNEIFMASVLAELQNSGRIKAEPELRKFVEKRLKLKTTGEINLKAVREKANAWLKGASAPMHHMVYDIVHYVDGNVKNKTPENRKVTGALAAYHPNDVYESVDGKEQMKNLRERLFQEVQSSGNSTGAITLSPTTTVAKIMGGRPWNTTTYTNPLRVLRPEDKLTLAVAVGSKKTGLKLDTNGSPLEKKLHYNAKDLTPGAVYMIVPSPNGDYYPYRLYTQKLGRIPGMAAMIADQIRKIKDVKNDEEKADILLQINDIVFIRDVKFEGGVYEMTVGKIDAMSTIPVADENLVETLNGLWAEVDVNKVNQKIKVTDPDTNKTVEIVYNEYVSDHGFITADVNPFIYFHSVKVVMAPITTSAIKETLKEAKPLPESKDTASSATPARRKYGSAAKKIGKTQVVLGKPRVTAKAKTPKSQAAEEAKEGAPSKEAKTREGKPIEKGRVRVDKKDLKDGDVVYSKSGEKFTFRGLRPEGQLGARSPRLEKEDGEVVIPGEFVELYSEPVVEAKAPKPTEAAPKPKSSVTELEKQLVTDYPWEDIKEDLLSGSVRAEGFKSRISKYINSWEAFVKKALEDTVTEADFSIIMGDVLPDRVSDIYNAFRDYVEKLGIPIPPRAKPGGHPAEAAVAKPRSKGRARKNNPKPSLFKEGESYAPARKEQVQAWLNKNLPNVPKEFADQLIEIYKKGGVKAWGHFYKNALVLYEGMPLKKAYHEAYHAVFNLMLTPAQQEQILNQASKEYGISRETNYTAKTQEILDYIDSINTFNRSDFDMMNDPRVNDKFTTAEIKATIDEILFSTSGDYAIEERLADEFAEYVQQDGQNSSLTGWIADIFKRLYEFLKSMFTQDIDIESMFFRINNRFYTGKPITSSNAHKLKPVASPVRVARNVQMINYYFFQALDEHIAEFLPENVSDVDAIKSVNPKDWEAGIQTLYARVAEGFKDAHDHPDTTDEQATELEDIINNFIILDENEEITGVGDYYGLALENLSKFGIRVNTKKKAITTNSADRDMDEKKNELNEEEDAIEGWQRVAIKTNGKDTLSGRVRRMLRQTTYYTLTKNGEFEQFMDDFGFMTFIPFDEVYNFLEKNLANIFDSDVMLDKLEELQYKRPEVYGILQKLYADESLKSQFFSNFAKAYSPHMVVQQVTKSWWTGDFKQSATHFRVFDANRKNLSQLLIDEWQDNLTLPGRTNVTDNKGDIDTKKARKSFAKFEAKVEEIKGKRTVNIEDNEILAEILAEFGIDVQPEALQAQFVEPKNQKSKVKLNAYDNYINVLDGTRSIRKLLSTIVNGNNPYEGEMAEGSSARVVARAIASASDTLHQDTFLNINNEQVYSYTLPTFLHKKMDEFKDAKMRQAYLNNWWYQGNKWLQDLDAENNEELLNEFETVQLSGLKMEHKKGVEYSEMTDYELDITDINMYNNNPWKGKQTPYAYYRLPILADSSQAPYVRFKKYTQDEVIDAFYQLALAEKKRIEIAAASNVKIKNWNDEVNNASRYHFVPIFNDPAVDISNETIAKDAIAEYLEQQLINEKQRLTKNGVLKNDGKFNKTTDAYSSNNPEFLRNYFYNKSLATAMLTQLLSVDLAFYSDYDNFQNRNAQVYKYTRMIDVNANWKGFTPGLTYNSIYLHDELINSELEKVVYKDLIGKGHSKSYAKQISKTYRSIKSTDAQTFLTLDRYKKIKVGAGEWNDNLEKAYRIEKRWKKDGDPTAEDTGISFSPIKPHYFAHETITENGTGLSIVTPVQHKNSEMILLPRYAYKSKKLKKLLKYMNNKQNPIDSAIFVSAAKVGEYGAASFANLEDATIHTNYNKFFGIQQEVPEHHIDTENLLASQIKKLIIADIPDSTVINGMTKKQIIETYQKLLTYNVIDSYNNTKDRMNDLRKIQAVLTDEIIDRGLGSHYKDAIEIVEDKEGKERFNMPLFFPTHAKRYDNILNSIVRREVTKQKINGGSYALMSSFGFSDKLRVVAKPGGGVEYMEVMLPAWTKKYFPKNASGEVDIESLEKTSPELLQLFGYRIPTEHKYSMRKIKVVGFTPSLMGGVAILPADIVNIAGEDFDIDKMYVMIPNFEVKDGIPQKLRYNYDNIGGLSKEQRDNAIMDLMMDIWSSPAVSDQILIPGNFEELKKLARESTNRELSNSKDANPIFPATQMAYFTRNMTGNDLIGIGAIHNVSHAITQFTNIKLNTPVKFDGLELSELNYTKATDGKLISRNVAQFVSAFVDNKKEPVAGDLNLNTFTIDTVMMMVRLGFPVDTAIKFITQPVIQVYASDYYRRGGTRAAETSAYKHVKDNLTKNKELKFPDKVKSFKSSQLARIIERDLTKLNPAQAQQQLDILYAFENYRKLADSITKLNLAIRADTLGVRKTMGGSIKSIMDVNAILEDKNLSGVADLILGDAYPLVKVSIEYGVRKPIMEILATQLPYNRAAYTRLYEKLSAIKGNPISEKEIDYINGLTLAYYNSGFGYFDPNKKDLVLNGFPKFFADTKRELDAEEYELLKYIKYKKGTKTVPFDRLEFVSGATVSDEQRENLTRSWKSMIDSDDPDVSFLAKQLVQYSFHTNSMLFTYAGFSHLIPLNYSDKLSYEGVSYSQYMYKLMDDASNPKLFDNFIDQLFRHDIREGLLLPTLTIDDLAKRKTHGKYTTSIIPKREFIRIGEDGLLQSTHFKMYSGDDHYTYRFSGTTNKGDYVFDLEEPLGFGKSVFEWKYDETPDTVIEPNKLPEIPEDKFFPTIDRLDPGSQMYQLDKERDLEIKYGLVDKNNVYKSFGLLGQGQVPSDNAYNKAKETAAKLNTGELRNTGYKARVTTQPTLEGKLKQIVKIFKENTDAQFQIESQSEQLPIEELNTLLKKRLAEVGFKVEHYSALWNRLGGSVTSMIDFVNKTIDVATGREKADTLPEEAGHVAEMFNIGTDRHRRLMDLIVNTPEYAEVKREYGEVYNNDETLIRRETIGKMMANAFIHKARTTDLGTIEVTSKPDNIIVALLKKMWNYFLERMGLINKEQLRAEVEALVGDIATEFLAGEYKETGGKVQFEGVMYQLGSNEFERARKILQDGIDSIYKKVVIYRRRASKELVERESRVVEALSKDLEKGTKKVEKLRATIAEATSEKERIDITNAANQMEKAMYKKGLADYVANANVELKKVIERYKEINRNPTTPEERRETIKLLKLANNYVNGFYETLTQIDEEDIFDPTDPNEAKIVEQTSKTLSLVNKIRNSYYKIGKPILVEVLKEFSTNPNAKVGEALDILEKDISWTQRMLDAIAEADDSIVNILDVMVKDRKHEARTNTHEFSKDILRLQKNLERAGIPTTHFMFERDFYGNLTGNLIDEYNHGEYDRRRQEWNKNNPYPEEKNFKTKEEFMEEEIRWKQKMGEWYDLNQQVHPDKERIKEEKKAEFFAMHPNKKLATKRYNEWLGENMLRTKYFDHEHGEYISGVKYIRELAIPAKGYKNKVWESIQKNPVQKEYYDFVKKTIKEADARLPEIYKLGNMAPQVRKDVFERMSFVDSTGKTTTKSLRKIFGEVKTAFGEQLTRHESDFDYAITDENDQAVNFLPMRYTKKIPDPTNLSLDLTSSMVAYMYSVNDYSEMSKIIDVLEFTKDVVGERDVKSGKINPVTMWKKTDKDGKPIMKEPKTSLAYQRLTDWMTMTVYGQESKEEGNFETIFGKVDKGKLADFLNMLTSLSTLALNIYSGISNLTVGQAMVRMEAMAGQFINNKELAKAGVIYGRHLPDSIFKIGQRLSRNKMDLWTQRMDTLQNYNRDYQNIDASRKTVFTRLMKGSSLYFMNHAGEHFIQTKMSIALAMGTMVKDSSGNVMNLWEAFDVKGDKLVIKPNLTKIASDKEGGLFKKEEDGKPLTERDIRRFVNKQNFLNKRLHGIYNGIDKSAMQHYSWGRLLLLFRKFIKPGWNRRFAKYTYNEEGEVFTEGYYATLARFIKEIYSELKKSKFSTVKNWPKLTRADKANFIRLFTEIAFIIASITAATILSGFADDDEDNYMLNLAAYEAYRMYTEIRFFSSYTEMWRIAKSPAALVGLIDKVIRFLDVWDWNTEVKKGKYKGLSRFEVGALNLIPLGGTFINFRTPEEQLKLYTNNGVTIF